MSQSDVQIENEMVVYRGGQHYITCDGYIHRGYDVNGKVWHEGLCSEWYKCESRDKRRAPEDFIRESEEAIL